LHAAPARGTLTSRFDCAALRQARTPRTSSSMPPRRRSCRTA
jgi:hypothetical protein